MKSEKPIPEPTEELKAKCDAENQFSNFDRTLRKVLAAPKSAVEANRKPKKTRAKRKSS